MQTRVHPSQMRLRRPTDRRSVSRSATRALDVLELMGQARRGLRAVEIAQSLDMSASSANQLLKTMVDSAHLTFDAQEKCYLPSPRLARFSAWMVANCGTDEQLRDLVTEIGEKSGALVTLTTPNDTFMQVVDMVDGSPLGEPCERGLRVTMFGSVIGTAYLSTLADAEIRRLAFRARVGAGDMAVLLAEIENVRRDGVADGLTRDGVWSVAAPLPRRGALAPFVIGLSGETERITSRLPALRTLLLDVARKSGLSA